MAGIRDPGSGIRGDHDKPAIPENRVASDGSGNPSPESRVPDPEWEQMVLVGRIARPHGVRGQVIVNPETDFIEDRFQPRATFWTRSDRGDEMLTVISARFQNGRPVIGFEGFATIEDVERLAGLDLRIRETGLQPLEPGTYYVHDLVGCRVATAAGEEVGIVSRVEGGAWASVLAVDGAEGEVLVPLAAAICVEVDVAARRIRIEPPEGLLELNRK